MLKKSLFGFVLFGALGTLLFAQTQPKVQIGEALSGKEAKEMLQNFPKEVKSAIKIPQKQTKVVKGARGGTYPQITLPTWSLRLYPTNRRWHGTRGTCAS